MTKKGEEIKKNEETKKSEPKPDKELTFGNKKK